ncbi:integrase family protein [Variovorax sp. J22P240]|uniref:tyrosine-type recombinase/integrase n=1 Tax=Variovorax sp. J22P240 TaxID=3053514 RepID=UPI0025772F2A|nr:integrase family protein [Variovorax sp. J22P240]MDM0002895.1 integrase family protein [Variovorax sp. J22P240]
MHFDARAAKQLQPDQHIMVDGCPGLRLEATATTKTWTYRYKSPVDGRMRQKAIGRWPAMSFGKAVSEWETLKLSRDAGNDPSLAQKADRAVEIAAAKEKRVGAYTVRRLVEDYLAGHIDVNRKAKGAAEVRRMMDRNLGPVAQLTAATLKRSEAFDFLEALSSTPVQAASIKQELGAAWDYALDAGRLPEESPNWWRLIMRGKLRSKGKELLGEKAGAVKRVLSDAEAGELIRWLPNFTQLADDALTLYLWTCTRGAEIMAMEAGEITDEPTGLWWTVPKLKTKNARHEHATDLRVPLVGRAEVVVRRRLAATPKGYLFPSRGRFGHVEQKTIGVAVHYHMPYAKTHPELERTRLPVTKWAPHDLRRTGRTLLAALGCPGEVGEAILGHVQPGIQGVYNRHAYDKERRVWLKKLDARLESLAAGTR